LTSQLLELLGQAAPIEAADFFQLQNLSIGIFQEVKNFLEIIELEKNRVVKWY